MQDSRKRSFSNSDDDDCIQNGDVTAKKQKPLAV